MSSYIPNTDIPLDPQAQEDPDHYTIKKGPMKGVVVTIKSIQPLLLNKVLRSVKVPKRPTYTTVTVTGKEQEHPMDEESAAETPGGKAMWEYYEEMKEEAQAEQNDRMTTAIFAMGSDFSFSDLPKVRNDETGEMEPWNWEAEHSLLGIDVPAEPRLKKAHLLSTSLEADEISSLTTKIMKKSGVDEEAVKEAEESFRNAVRDRPEQSRQLVDAGANQGGYTQQQLEVQRPL